MKLHANAALGPKGRLAVVLRVIEQGWSVIPAWCCGLCGVDGRLNRRRDAP
jgi:hypothetical protein